MCKDNFIGDSNLIWVVFVIDSCDSILGLLVLRVSSIVDLLNIMSNVGDCFSIK